MQLGSRGLKGTAVRAAAPPNPSLLPGSSEAPVSTAPGGKLQALLTNTLYQIHQTGSPETSFQRGLILGPPSCPCQALFLVRILQSGVSQSPPTLGT